MNGTLTKLSMPLWSKKQDYKYDIGILFLSLFRKRMQRKVKTLLVESDSYDAAFLVVAEKVGWLVWKEALSLF